MMKKKITIIFILLFSMVAGCTQFVNKENKTNALANVYLAIGTQMEKNKGLNKKYIKQLLDGYEYKQSKTMARSDQGILYKQHIFMNKNETLTILEHTDVLTEIEILYENKGKEREIMLRYSTNQERVRNGQQGYVNIVVDNIFIHETLSKMLQKSNSSWNDIYTNLVYNIATINDISLDVVKNKLKVSPTLEEEINLQIKEEATCYSFVNNKEDINIYKRKDKNEIVRVHYSRNDTLFLKEIIVPSMITERDTLFASVIASVDMIAKQKEILEYLSKN